ncbi:hypothetical protein A35E_00233 [secondary endosymbiont of Heteropsylla cubana]|uniref:Uncharacterized protein n=1 Tax=secondary endosymbiont of Heteropsylla cubana TaxID=134287 RepID=J3TGH7_9ENTR|nr:hypothetical protein A35E_00233 [secondary endosymbiont of Heteropsylla cubana]
MRTFLKRCIEENVGSAAELILTDIIKRKQGPEVDHGYINQQLKQHPTMHLFHRLMKFYLSETKKIVVRKKVRKNCGILWKNKFILNLDIIAKNAILTLKAFIGVAHLVNHRLLLNLFEG